MIWEAIIADACAEAKDSVARSQAGIPAVASLAGGAHWLMETC